MFNDKELNCIECSKPFVFKAGEQEFYQLKGLQHEPKRCEDCRIFTRLTRAGKNTDVVSFATCDECSTKFAVPFRPLGHKPVYCNTCFRVKKSEEIKHRPSAPDFASAGGTR